MPEHANARRAVVDYYSKESLVAAITGTSAVICALPPEGPTESAILDAALEAGIPRFIPSWFGSDTTNDKASTLPVFDAKVKMGKKLEALAGEGKISWVALVSGPYLDFCIKVGLLVNPKAKSVVYYDGGDKKFSTTKLATVGKALAAVLDKWDQVKNRAARVQGVLVTQKQLVDIAKQYTGADGWSISTAYTADLDKQSRAKYASGQADRAAAFDNLKVALWGEGYGGAFPETDNEVLGVKEMTAQELDELVKSFC